MARPPFGIILLLVAVLIVLPTRPSASPNDYKLPYTVRERTGIHLSMWDPVTNPDPASCCKLIRKGKIYDLTSKSPIITEDGEILEVVPLDTQCAIRVIESKESSAGLWLIQNRNNVTRKIEVTMLPQEKTVECPKSDTDGCRLIHLETREPRKCGSNVTDWGPYKCVYKVKGAMAFQEETLPHAPEQLRNRPSTKPWPEVKLSEIYENYLLRCETEGTVQSCVAEHITSRRWFNIRDGLQHQHYSSFQTSLEDGICEFEIPEVKGTVADKDLGKWRITMRGSGGEQHICQFLVDTEENKQKRLKDAKNKLPVLNRVKGSTINCAEDYPHEVTTCYIRHPDGDTMRQDKDGACEFQLDKSGHWICGYYTGDNEGEVEPVDVQQEIMVYDSEAINGRLDEEKLRMSCEHLTKSPLKTCLFISPSNRPYSVAQADLDSEVGVCAIGLDKVMDEMLDEQKKMKENIWKCVIQTKGSDAIYSTDVLLPSQEQERSE